MIGAPSQNIQQWQPGAGGTHTWDNAPSRPPIDDPNAEPEAYNDTTTDMETFAGYDDVGPFEKAARLAAPSPPPPPQGEPPLMNFDNVANLSEPEARQALLKWVQQNCCYGEKCATEMTVDNIMPSSALHYTLETFTEDRSTAYAQEPYRGGFIDGPGYGMPPQPWSIPCAPNESFHSHRKLVEVPHTSFVRPCGRCNAMGFIRCHRCHGTGQTRCFTCGGDGFRSQTTPEGMHHQVPCHTCGADGLKRCHHCGGDGRIMCLRCQGFRYLRCFIQLTVNFINHLEDHIIEKTDMPDELVRDVHGIPIFQQTLPQVWPITTYPIQEINTRSTQMVHNHRIAFSGERQLHQRQILRAVPVTEVHYKWNEVMSRFWIYGQERSVYCPDYPQQCCWGCTIL